MARCHGDPVIDDLRIARNRLERSAKTLAECTVNARRDAERYDVGSYLEDLIDDLENGKLESIDSAWFGRNAAQVLECVDQADEDDEPQYASPEEYTWRQFRSLATAMRNHAVALRILRDAEKRALPSPVNAKGHPSGRQENTTEATK